MQAGWKRQAVALLIFGVAFGYVEAAVVTYLRPPFVAARARFSAPRAGEDLFPLLTARQAQAAGPETTRLVKTEVVREAATLVMLGAVAAAVGSGFRQWFACFLLAFGAWDLAYYVFLKVLIDWPKSLLAWDILFLIPVPWVGPVLAPVLVSLTMIGAGLVYGWRESHAKPLRLRTVHWLGAWVAGALILAAFVWDWRGVAAGGMPQHFPWPLFAGGEVLGVLALLHALRARE